MNKTNIFYFHGLETKGKSRLCAYLESLNIWNIQTTLFKYFTENPIEKFQDEFKLGFNILIGSSFGAFPALYFGLNHKIPFMLINPSITPFNTLKRKGITDISILESYKKTEIQLQDLIKKDDGANPKRTIIISKNDNVVNNDIILSTLKINKEDLIETDWGHIVPTEDYGLIVKELTALVNAL